MIFCEGSDVINSEATYQAADSLKLCCIFTVRLRPTFIKTHVEQIFPRHA